tara:strand:+ start:470 stop:1642 length:1173 start_codon:yes stop_codon:yes gene_type:complete
MADTNRFEELIAKQFAAQAPEKENAQVEQKSEEKTETSAADNTGVDGSNEAAEPVQKQEEVQEEAKAQEQESSLNTENTQETQEVPESPAKVEKEVVSEDTPSVSFDFEDALIEKSSGKYSSYDELAEAMAELETKASNTFANEQIARLNEYVAEGGDMMDFLTTQLTDYSEMSDVDVIKAQMKLTEKELTSEEINLLFEDSYKLNETQWSETEIKLAKIKLKRDANKARTDLIDFQKKNSIPKSKAQEAENKAQIEAAQKEWVKKVEASLRNFKDIKVDIGDKGEKFSYSVSDDTIKSIRKTNKNLQKFWDRYINEDGTQDVNKLTREMAILNDFDNIVRSVYAQARSNGKEAVVKDLKNPSYTPESKPTAEKRLTIQEQISQQLKNNF